MQIDYKILRFAEGYTEFWYQVDITSDLSVTKEKQPEADSIFVTYQYQLFVQHIDHTDSGMVEGTKGAVIKGDQKEVYFIDFVPIYLYPGRFRYIFTISSESWICSDTGTVIINNMVDTQSISDLVIGKKCVPNTFLYHDLAFIPTVDNELTLFDTLVSYFRLYGLQPDSLYYTTQYEILDDAGQQILSHERTQLKYSYNQIDTFSLALAPFVHGNYTFRICVRDSVSGLQQSMNVPLTITAVPEEYEDRPFYDQIQYLVDKQEYKRFTKLDKQGQRYYLKHFWAEHDYVQFEKRILSADENFSTFNIKGRDSERGKYLIKYGAPNAIEVHSMTQWSEELELWRYEKQGIEVLFCDINDNGNPEHITDLTIGELSIVIETGIGPEDMFQRWPWLRVIAPGTHPGKFGLDDE